MSCKILSEIRVCKVKVRTASALSFASFALYFSYNCCISCYDLSTQSCYGGIYFWLINKCFLTAQPEIHANRLWQLLPLLTAILLVVPSHKHGVHCLRVFIPWLYLCIAWVKYAHRQIIIWFFLNNLEKQKLQYILWS